MGLSWPCVCWDKLTESGVETSHSWAQFSPCSYLKHWQKNDTCCRRNMHHAQGSGTIYSPSKVKTTLNRINTLNSRLASAGRSYVFAATMADVILHWKWTLTKITFFYLSLVTLQINLLTGMHPRGGCFNQIIRNAWIFPCGARYQ